MSNFFKKNKRFFLFLLAITIYFGVMFVWAEFYKTPFKDFKDFFILFLQWGTVVFAVFGLLYLLSINKYIFGVIFPILVILASALAFFRFTLNITLTANLWNIIFHNDIRTSIDLITLPLILFVLINIGIALFIIWTRIKKVNCSGYIYHILISIFIILCTVGINSKIKAPIIARSPYVLFYSFQDYIANKKIIEKIRPDISKGSFTESDSLLVVYIQGESLRADHLALNGYYRQTTPLLKLDSVISFTNIYSPFTNTDNSIPYILTNADSLHPDLGYKNQSFISIFKHTGFMTYWVANQIPSEAYVYFANESNSLIYTNAGKTVYNFEPNSWLDEEMEIPFEQILNKSSKLKLVILHEIGSHWWYKAHYSKEFERYTPVIQSRIVSSSTQQEMINTYDNTILYTDNFINRIIQKIKNKKAILIYLSDHGEALGEDNHWLHANDALPIHHPACFVWLSESYKNKFPEAEHVLKQNSTHYFNTSFLFHSILDGAAIHSPFLNTRYSIFRKQH